MSKFNLVRLMWYRNKVKWKYRTVSGTPPLTYKAKSDGVLKNYRIYGNTVNGESVGDKTRNLFDSSITIENGTINADTGVDSSYQSQKRLRTSFIGFLPAGMYTINADGINRINCITLYNSQDVNDFIETIYSTTLLPKSFTLNEGGYIRIAFSRTDNSDISPNDISNAMLNSGSTSLPYEPYGYRVPVTVTNGTDTQTTNLYLPEQIKTVGGEAEYIDFMEQKQHFADGTSADVTLPAMPTLSGTNTLTVGTEVQPSKVYLKGKIEEIPTRTVSYYSQDGSTLLGTETVESGGNASGLQDTPTKPDTEQYTYTFVGWSNTTNATTAMSGILNNITADKSVYAAFSETEKTFTVTFYNGAELIYTAQNVSYNGTAVYSGATPTKAETSEYTYTFAGWNTNSSASTADADALTNVTADRTVYAIFTAVSKGYTVYFYNGETLLETVTGVPSGGTATYTGATPTSSQAGYIFSGWSPSNTNITADTSCYAQFKAPYITDSWEVISQRSAAGTAQNYYSVGDCKPIELNGTMGTLALNTTLYVYILGFNHNSTYEPNGITFGCFKTAATNGIDVCLVDSKYGSSDTSGTKYFNMSHRGSYNYGGWKGSDMRYDILGSTDVQPSGYGSAPTTSKTGYDATSTCATTPVANTLMSCLPSDLRSVMKPMTKYTDNKGKSSDSEANVTTSIDYLPLLSEYEVQGTGTYTNKYEKNKQAQYTYYSGGNSKVKYSHSATSTAVAWWVRSPCRISGDRFCRVGKGGGADIDDAGYSYGVAPCFLV